MGSQHAQGGQRKHQGGAASTVTRDICPETALATVAIYTARPQCFVQSVIAAVAKKMLRVHPCYQALSKQLSAIGAALPRALGRQCGRYGMLNSSTNSAAPVSLPVWPLYKL